MKKFGPYPPPLASGLKPDVSNCEIVFDTEFDKYFRHVTCESFYQPLNNAILPPLRKHGELDVCKRSDVTERVDLP